LFRKVLIANRGEIAIRVARTCRRLGIPTVAVYATNDTNSSHVRECEEAYCLGSGAAAAYLDTDRILRAIRDTGADAVHPGYGFLSENAGFAQAVIDGIDGTNDNDNDNNTNTSVAWLGPPPRAITDMGCKLRSKVIAKEAGVAIIPGGDDRGALESLEDALEVMQHDNNNNNNNIDDDNRLHYPVLLKAAAGGGGKGMRICYDDRELREAYPMAKSEGLKFFADDRLLLEQYLENPHHIEFQVVCSKSSSTDSGSSSDNTSNDNDSDNDNDNDNDSDNGNDQRVDVAIFAERECSIQRRNQKVVEESPSCLLTEETRRKMMEQTTLLCQSVGYEGAGTVEWLVVNDSNQNDDNNNKQQFYFLEMNTRLQVEHPITEAVSGNVDLVEAMLRVGAGKGLPQEWYETAEVVDMAVAATATTGDSNDDSTDTTSNNNKGGNMLVMPWKGHAIEGRIYAENPLRGYLPSTGPLVPYKEPSYAIRVSDGSNDNTSDSDHETKATSTSATADSYLRLDSGVVEGHVVTPFYDPMLSKIISYAPTRQEAVEVLSKGLDSYVIEGINHNARLIQAVLRHPSFQSGDTPTSFLEAEIPDFGNYSIRKQGGQSGSLSSSLLTTREEEELAVAVAVIWRAREERLGRPPTGRAKETSGGASAGRREFVVRLDGLFGDDDCVGEGKDKHKSTGAISVTLDEGPFEEGPAEVRRLAADTNGNTNGNDNGSEGGTNTRLVAGSDFSLDFENYLAHLTLDGTARTIQVLAEKPSGELTVQMCGAQYAKCLVQSPREYELSKHVLPPVKEDTSNKVMSPMPGTLIAFSDGVRADAYVDEGQELCIVEAMKMQNVIRAPREGTIAALRVEQGAALVTDQIILEYRDDEAEDESLVA